MPRIIGWTAFAAVLVLIGPIAFAVVMLKSSPEAEGSDPAKLLVALIVLAAAGLAGWLAKRLTLLVLRLAGRG